MKLKEMLELGKKAGFETAGDIYLYVDLNVHDIFGYDYFEDEMDELTNEFNVYYDRGLLDGDTSIDEALKLFE